MTLREVSARVGITERAAQRIVRELEQEQVVRIQRVGRRNRYEINMNAPLRHPEESFLTVGQLLSAFVPSAEFEIA